MIVDTDLCEKVKSPCIMATSIIW